MTMHETNLFLLEFGISFAGTDSISVTGISKELDMFASSGPFHKEVHGKGESSGVVSPWLETGPSPLLSLSMLLLEEELKLEYDFLKFEVQLPDLHIQ